MKLAAFAVASLVLAITPGPGVLFIVARTLAEGRAAGLRAVAGVAAGNGANAVAASLGLAALFTLWPAAFTALRWGGGLYLLWLGWTAWRAPAHDSAAPLRQAFWVALLNPKTTLFFAALLPPFLDPAGSAVAQSLALAALFVAIAAGTDALYALAAGTLAHRLPGAARAGRFAAVAVYLALGLYALWPHR
jgi:threonine/homoserine/homoserine lactone efflux protein